jgi:O-antigen ligase
MPKFVQNFSKNFSGLTLFAVAILGILMTQSYSTDAKSQLVGSSFVLLFGFIYLLFAKSKNWTIDLLDLICLLFLVSFNLSLVFSSVPFGYKEFVTFNIGFILLYLVRSFNFAEITPLEKKALSAWSYLFPVLFISLISYSLVLYFDSPLDRFAGFFLGDESFSSYPNVMATTLIFAIPYFLLKIFNFDFQSQRFLKVVNLTSFILSSLALWLTASRGVILSMLLVAGLYFVFKIVVSQNRLFVLKNTFITFLVVVSTLGLSFAFNAAKSYSLDLVARADIIGLNSQDVSAIASANERLDFFKHSFKIGLENPLLGAGPGSFQYFNPKYQTISLANSEHPHNIFLKLFSESGIIALAFFVTGLILLKFSSAKQILQDSTKNTFLVQIYVLSSFLVSSLLDYNLGFILVLVLVATTTGIAFSKYKKLPFLYTVFKSTKIKLFFMLSLILFGLFNLNQAYIYFNLNSSSGNLTKVFNAPIGFKDDYLLQATNLNQNNGLNNTYPKFIQTLSYKAFASKEPSQKFDYLIQYLNLDPLNNFQVYLELLSLDTSNPKLTDLPKLLANYNYLLSVNSHHTVASKTPYFVYQIYQNLLSQNPNDQELLAQFQQFEQIYFNEMAKFDTRYKTNLISDFFKWKQAQNFNF